LPVQLTFLSRRFPQARVTVVEEITPVLLERLRASVVDVAILALPIRGHEFEAFPLLKEDLFAALPKKHKFAGRAVISLKDLRAEDFLLCEMATVFAIRQWRLVIGAIASADCF